MNRKARQRIVRWLFGRINSRANSGFCAALILLGGCTAPATHRHYPKKVVVAPLPVTPKPLRKLMVRQHQPEQYQLTAPFVPLVKYLDWDWITNSGPVWFEVWHTNALPATLTIQGTNVPGGFTLFTNVPSSHVPLAVDRAQDYFIVRAANRWGVSDWNR